MKTAIIHTTLYDYHTYRQDQYIVFDDVIFETGPMTDFVDQGYQIIDGHDRFVMPTFVSGHTHIYSALARGMSVNFNPRDFMGILEDLWWKMDKEIDLDITKACALVSAIDHLKCGVTTLIDHHASGKAITGTLNVLSDTVTKTVGLRGAFCFETSDRFDVQLAIEENMSFMETHHSKTSCGLFGMHASISLSDQTLEAIQNVLKGRPIHIHVAESDMDEKDAIRRTGMRVIKRLDSFKLINPGSIIAHAIHVDDEELEIIKKRQAIIAVNVTSNMNNGVGLPDIMRFKAHGIPVIIGNDGLNPSMAMEALNVLYASHHLLRGPTAFQHETLKDMIETTYQVASRMFKTKLGRLEKDYAADLLVIPYVPPTPIDGTNAFGHVYYGLFHAFRPEHVFARGVHRVKNYAVDDALMIQYQESVRSAMILWDRIRKGETHEHDNNL